MEEDCDSEIDKSGAKSCETGGRLQHLSLGRCIPTRVLVLVTVR